jgi:hypothetical protein
MSNNVVIPLLGNEGWVVDPSRQLNVMFAHSLVSDANQSVNYKGSITSLMHLIITYQQNPIEMCDAIEAMYIRYFKKVFDTVDVNADYTTNPNSSYQINLSIVVTKNGSSYSLAYTGSVDNGTLTNTLRGLTS